MTPRPLAWMKPGDLILFDLELLPWPAYLRLVEGFFNVRDFSLRAQRSSGNLAEFQVCAADGQPEALLHCVHGRKSVDQTALGRLTDEMQAQGIRMGYLYSPGGISSDVYLRAGDANVELYSGNKLRVRIESLRTDLRREVMDRISAKPDMSRATRINDGSGP